MSPIDEYDDQAGISTAPAAPAGPRAVAHSRCGHSLRGAERTALV